ncbi:MAG: hypothetical protein VZQ47_02310 [Treponema sp.]|nr:hypothetical protein [Treponema sp.]
MKISKLSFATERVNLKQGDQCGNYLAFYFFIDGKKIESDDYNPANCWDILDERAQERNLVVLAHCGCGVWECSSLIAKCRPVSDNVVEWTVDESRCERDPQKFYFDKSEYDKVLAELTSAAQDEKKKWHENQRPY